MKTLILSCLLATISVGLSAQINISQQSLNDFYAGFRTAKFIHGEDANAGIEGSPCEVSEFVASDLVTTSRQLYSGVPMRYNIYQDHVEFKDENGQILYFGAPEMVDYVAIGKRKFVYVPYQLGPRVLRGYLAVLEEGPVTLLLKMNVMLKQAEKPQAYKDAEPARFVRTADDFYLRKGTEEAKLLKGKKELKELLPVWPAEMDEYLKKNRVKFSDEEDLKGLIAYYNSLNK